MQSIISQLTALQSANKALYELTVDLDLLKAISSMTFHVDQAIKVLLEQSEGLTTIDFVKLLEESEAIEILDEVVDTDAISELENLFFSAIDNMEDSIIGLFLTELIEKIERHYTNLVESIHALNSRLNEYKNN